jgi:hypothetical protein
MGLLCAIFLIVSNFFILISRRNNKWTPQENTLGICLAIGLVIACLKIFFWADVHLYYK